MSQQKRSAGWFHRHEPKIALLGIGLAITGVVITLYEVSHVLKIVETTQEIRNTAPPNPSEPFPHDLPTIVQVVDHTCQHLDIMTDVTAYGVLTALDETHGNFGDYDRALTDLRNSTVKGNRQNGKCAGAEINNDKNVRVRLLVFAPALRQKERPAQLGADFLKNKSNKNKVLSFYKRYWDELPTPKNTALEQYVDRLDLETLSNDLEHLNTNEEQKLHKPQTFEIKFSTDEYMLFFWVRDGVEASYEFSPPWLTTQEMGTGAQMFVTRDQPLLSVFSKIFAIEWKRGCSLQCIRGNQCTQDQPSCRQFPQ